MKKTTILRQLLSTEKTIVAPASYDCLSAMIVENVGFKATFLSGYCLAASAKGMPDVGTESRADVVARAMQVTNAVDIPVICDAGNGYGGPIGTYQSIRELEAAGVAGCFIEDQSYPPACPGLRTPTVVPMEEFMPKLKAALEARTDEDFVIIARTDAGASLGLDAAIERCHAFKEAGADLVICTAGMPKTKDELLGAIKKIGVPMGPMPPHFESGITLKDYEDTGNMKIISGLETLMTVAKSMKDCLTELKEKGRSDSSKAMSMPEWMELMKLKKWTELEKKYM